MRDSGRGEVGGGAVRTGRRGGNEGGVTVKEKRVCLLKFRQEKVYCFVTGNTKLYSLKQECMYRKGTGWLGPVQHPLEWHLCR